MLNKCDRVNTQQLMRVYGALMWSLGKVINTPEVSRVYIGSFWDQPYLFDEQRGLFEAEQEDLFKDLQCIPRGSATRKLNDLIRRCRMIRVSDCLFICLLVCLLFTLGTCSYTVCITEPNAEYVWS